MTEQASRYDMIIGCDLQKALGIIIDCGNETINWNNSIVSMKNVDDIKIENYAITDSESMEEATDRMRKILDAK